MKAKLKLTKGGMEMDCMKIRMLVKDINVKSLVTGDKSARVTLETFYPDDIKSLMLLGDQMEVTVEFSIDKKEDK